MSEEYMAFWRSDYKPMEREQIAANRALIPFQARTAKMEQVARQKLLPMETEYQAGRLKAGIQETKMGMPVMGEYYKQALRGVDPERKVREARADVAGEFVGAEEAGRRELGRFGVSDPTSARFQGGQVQRGIEKAKAVATAATGARTAAEEESFRRLSHAAGTYKGGVGG